MESLERMTGGIVCTASISSVVNPAIWHMPTTRGFPLILVSPRPAFTI